MVEKTNVTVGTSAVFTANNINGTINARDLNANSTTYTYSGVNKTGSTITNVRVSLGYNKQTGKSESITCDVYGSYADYQNNTNHLGSATVRLTQGSNTATFDMALSGNNQIAEDENFVILFSNNGMSKGSFSSITIEFNV